MAKNHPPAQADIIKIAAEAGARAALETLDKEKRKAQKSRYDRRLRNTRMLLRNYRMFKEHTSNAIFEKSQLDENAIDILDMIYEASSESEVFVESIKRSVARTRIIITHIDEMLNIYEIICSRSDKPEDDRRYRVIKALYIVDDILTVKEIAAAEHTDERTVYRDIDRATEKLSALIFGIDGLKKE
ncbi:MULTISPECIES: hypothetical protein [unclassified Dehalobacter]|uniref:hypothetical protein n=1 Tax=unclassified Dehalobacter TaxID=2635733 RepID=UPI001053145F|nr:MULTISPECIES: hypothetical protein [unclassified Dehalobacter]TCX51945.1 hypothetical protein C1I36_06405 [Dehalobacter sp. 14DCB1]TCX53005.1 hypothetical protein C1I38_08085 [Dehalobacter sp. 12DCB1]